MSTFRFIHAADIHLDRALKGLPSDEEIPADVLGATRTAFTRLIDLAIDERVDFLVLAGDLYDTDWQDFSTGHFFLREMARLHRESIPVYLIHGNHDAVQEMTRKLTPPPNVHVFDARKPQTFPIERLGVALHGQSYQEAATTANLAANYPAPVPNAFNIGVLHTALTGREGHLPYAPCSEAELAARGYAYWALGHVHSHAVIATDPYIVFCGNLQGLHVNEMGARGAVLVEVEDGKVSALNRVHTDVLRWFRIDVDISGIDTIDQVPARYRQALEGVLHVSGDAAVCARVTLKGQAPVAPKLRDQLDYLREEFKAQAIIAAKQPVYIEKIRVLASTGVNRTVVAEQKDAVAELQAILAELATDADAQSRVKEEISVLVNKLPTGVTEQGGELLRQFTDGDLAGLMTDSGTQIIDRLASGAAT